MSCFHIYLRVYVTLSLFPIFFIFTGFYLYFLLIALLTIHSAIICQLSASHASTLLTGILHTFD